MNRKFFGTGFVVVYFFCSAYGNRNRGVPVMAERMVANEACWNCHKQYTFFLFLHWSCNCENIGILKEMGVLRVGCFFPRLFKFKWLKTLEILKKIFIFLNFEIEWCKYFFLHLVCLLCNLVSNMIPNPMKMQCEFILLSYQASF